MCYDAQGVRLCGIVMAIKKNKKQKTPLGRRFRGCFPVVIDIETGGFNAETDAILEIAAIFLVQWGNIKTMMHYPEREGFDFPSEFKKEIGFKFKDEESVINK